MARKDNTILGKLNAKGVEFQNKAAEAEEAVEYHKSQIASNEAVAALSKEQANAVRKAQAILSEAGINF